MIAELSGIIVTITTIGFTYYRLIIVIMPLVTVVADWITKYLCGDRIITTDPGVS